MVFDASHNLLQADDGGIYRLVDPNNRLDQRQWMSANGNIRPTEFHSVAYDPLSGIVFGWYPKTTEHLSNRHQVNLPG